MLIIFTRRTILFLCLILIFTSNCSKTKGIIKSSEPDETTIRSEFDTSAYHSGIGRKLLDKYSGTTNRKRQDYYLKKADLEIDKAKDLSEDEPQGINYQLYNNLGLLAYYKKDYDEAVKNFKLSQELNKTNIESYMYLGKLYYETRPNKEWQKKAEESFINVLSRRPGDLEVNFWLGKLNYERLNFNNAQKYLNKIINLEKTKNNFYYTKESKKILRNIRILSKLSIKNPVAKYIGTRDVINRSELSYLIINELLNNNLPENKKEQKINDLPDDLYKDSVRRVVNAGIITLNQNNFYPEKEVTRIQFTEIALKIYLLKTEKENFGLQYSSVKSPMKDIRSSHPFYIPTMFALENKYFQLDKDRNFSPHNKVSGVEGLSILNDFKEQLKLIVNK